MADADQPTTVKHPANVVEPAEDAHLPHIDEFGSGCQCECGRCDRDGICLCPDCVSPEHGTPGHPAAGVDDGRMRLAPEVFYERAAEHLYEFGLSAMHDSASSP